MHDTYASDEMIRHLSERYGEIIENFYVNYDMDRIMG